MDVLENAVTEKNVLVEAAAFPTDDRVTYKDSTYEIVSKVAYLIGVPKRIFDNEHEAPKIEIYEKLDADKTARIIRHLCIIRTAIERNFKHINERMKFSYLSISSMPEYVPQDSLQQLNADGVSFIKKSSTKLSQHIVEINKLISDRINNCKKLFLAELAVCKKPLSHARWLERGRDKSSSRYLLRSFTLLSLPDVYKLGTGGCR